ncbi:MAG: hypothetical protein ACSNEK_06760 [Parachlamydiaceae bacterium]
MTIFLQIPKRGAHCSEGKESFHEGMQYYSYVQLAKEGVYTRHDFCQRCWDKLNISEKTFWKGQIQKKEAIIPKTLEEGALLYFDEIYQSSNRQDELFVLALYLTRKKLFAFRKSLEQHDLYERLDTEEMIAIPKVALSSLNLIQLQSTLAEKLKSAYA